MNVEKPPIKIQCHYKIFSLVAASRESGMSQTLKTHNNLIFSKPQDKLG